MQKYYDSMYRNHPIFYDILELIKFNLKMGKIIHFVFMRSHINICESPDILARQARNLPFILPRHSSARLQKDNFRIAQYSRI